MTALKSPVTGKGIFLPTSQGVSLGQTREDMRAAHETSEIAVPSTQNTPRNAIPIAS